MDVSNFIPDSVFTYCFLGTSFTLIAAGMNFQEPFGYNPAQTGDREITSPDFGILFIYSKLLKIVSSLLIKGGGVG